MSNWANTFSSDTIVVSGTFNRNDITLVVDRTPTGSRDESQAVATVVVSVTT